MTQCFAPLGEGCGEGVQHPSPLSYVASKAQQLKSLKRDKLLCFFFSCQNGRVRNHRGVHQGCAHPEAKGNTCRSYGHVRYVIGLLGTVVA